MKKFKRLFGFSAKKEEGRDRKKTSTTPPVPKDSPTKTPKTPLRSPPRPIPNVIGSLPKIQPSDKELYSLGVHEEDQNVMRAQGAIPRERTSSSQQQTKSVVNNTTVVGNGHTGHHSLPNGMPHFIMEPLTPKRPDGSMGDMERFRIDNNFERLSSYASSGEAINAASELPNLEWKVNEYAASEASVVTLQDRLQEMEKAHHSTNEELQATLQELADLQNQLADMHLECERMGEEKHVLLESLCRQTEKLEDARMKVDTLQELLIEEQVETSGAGRELKLVDLLKSAQEERESLLLKQEELNSQLNELRNSASTDEQTTSRLEERITVLESAQNALKAERNHVEGELAASREEASSLTIEINRLNTLLDHAIAKISDLEQARSLTDKSDFEEVIDMSRKEKDNLETQVAHLQEQLSKSICEVNKLTDQIQKLQEELKVSRNNAKSAVSDLKYDIEQIKAEKTRAVQELQDSTDLINELQIQVGCLAEDKLQLEAVLSEAQKSLAVSEKKLRDMEKVLSDKTTAHNAKTLEWEQFQSDLLVTVRVANDMKTEALSQLDTLSEENTVLRDKLKTMETQIEKFKAKAPPTSSLSDTSASVLSSVQQDLATRRTKQDNRLSVKSLIESIENATKHAKAGPGSQNTDNFGCDAVDTASDSVPSADQNGSDGANYATSRMFTAESVTEPPKTLASKLERRMSSGDIVGDKDPLLRLAKHGGSKRNALLKWCQTKTDRYPNIDITNFSTSWNDGLALCALLHTYLPSIIPYDDLASSDARRNFSLAFAAAESVGIPTTLDLQEMVQTEKPDWKRVMDYITAIFKHFES